MPQLTLRTLRQRIRELKPNSRLDYLRQQIAGRATLKAEVRQLVIELEQRKEVVARGELPAYSTWEIQREIDARLNTVNIDHELEAMNCVIFDPAAMLVRNMLDYDLREAHGPVQKTRETLCQLQGAMERGIHEREKTLQYESRIIRSGPWEPDPPHERRRRELQTELDNYRSSMERQVKDAKKNLEQLQAAENDARNNMEVFRHWVFTGSLEGPPQVAEALTKLATA
jgi:hypothetical protein